MLGYDFWIQLVVVLIALFYGARKGGMALGLFGLCGPVHLLVPDGALRYRPRRLHDAADYLRRSDQEQHSS